MSNIRIAVFHTVFNSQIKGGGERLALEIRNHWRADLVAGGIDLGTWGKENSGNDSFVDLMWRENLGFHYLVCESRIPVWRRIKRNLCFRFAPRAKALNHYDLVIFSGNPAGISKRIKGPKKIYYCNTPPRHLTDQKRDFLRKIPLPLRFIVDWLFTRELKRYIREIGGMDRIISNSENIRQRLLDYTGLDSQVVFPAVFTERFQFLGQRDYYLSYARLDDWKRIKLIIAAFKILSQKKLIIASSGPRRHWVEKETKHHANMEYVGQVSDERLRELVGHCIAGIYIPINEDAGITQCELMAAGKPVIGVREGGLLETVIDKKTGILIQANPTADDLAAAVFWLTPTRALHMKASCIRQAKKFGQHVFFKKFASIIRDLGLANHH